MRMKLISVLAGASALTAAGTAYAGPVTFEYSGKAFIVHDALGTLSPSIVSGDPFALSYTFESATPDSSANGNTGIYLDSSGLFLDLTFVVGDATFVLHPTSTNGAIFVQNNVGGGHDRYQSFAFLDDAFGYTGIRFTQNFIDDSETAFSGDSLPLTAPNPADFNDISFLMQAFVPTGLGFQINFRPDPFQVSDPVEVPEPSSIAIFGFGLAAIGFLARTRARRRGKSSSASRRMPAMKGNLHGALAVACLLAVPGAAQAGPITFDYMGTVDSITGTTAGLPPSIALGAEFRMRYIFESTTPDSDILSPSHGLYLHSSGLFTDFTVTIGGVEFVFLPTSPSVYIRVTDSSDDSFLAGSDMQDAYGYRMSALQNFYDESATALGSAALPTIAPDPSAFDYHAYLQLSGRDGAQGFFHIKASNPRIFQQVVDVPEPSSLALFGAGLAMLGIGARVRRRRRYQGELH